MNSSPGSTTTPTDGWTVQRILEWTTSHFRQKGIESPRLEAELLLAHARNCRRIHLYTDFTELLSEEERTVMRGLVQRRAKREPIAYIVGTREFYGRSFEVAPGVLIPRPETETLVDVCLERIPKNSLMNIVEVGFGSGCIAVTLACQRPECRIFATDLSDEAMAIASRNVCTHEVDARVTLLNGDALSPFLAHPSRPPDLPRQFDGLVSNPPYVRDDERTALDPEVRDHEPSLALFAGADGLDVVRRIVSQAPKCLREGAFLAMEIDPEQSDTVMQLLQDQGFTSTSMRKDLNGQLRIVEAVWPGRESPPGQTAPECRLD